MKQIIYINPSWLANINYFTHKKSRTVFRANLVGLHQVMKNPSLNWKDKNNLKCLFTWYCWVCSRRIKKKNPAQPFMMNSRYCVIHWKWGGCVIDSYSSSVLLADAYRYDSPIGRPLVHFLWHLLQHFISNQHALRLRRIVCLHINQGANTHAPNRKSSSRCCNL